MLAPFIQEHVEPLLIDTLGNIPGIGLLFAGPPLGIGVLTAGFILAIMVLPFISAIMRDVFETVPQVLKESAFGLGATTAEVVWRVVLPYARVGAIGGILLGLGRALGETMAITFVIGNSHHIHASLLQPGTTISAALANEFTEAVGDLYQSSLIALGLILFAITFVVLAIAAPAALSHRAGRGGLARCGSIRAAGLPIGSSCRCRWRRPGSGSCSWSLCWDAGDKRHRSDPPEPVHHDHAAAGQRRRARQRDLRQRDNDRHRDRRRHPDRRSSPEPSSRNMRGTAGSAKSCASSTISC